VPEEGMGGGDQGEQAGAGLFEFRLRGPADRGDAPGEHRGAVRRREARMGRGQAAVHQLEEGHDARQQGIPQGLGRARHRVTWISTVRRTDMADNSDRDDDEVARRGNELIRTRVEPFHRPKDDGKFVAIDLVTGEYEIDEDDYTAVKRLRSRIPNARP